MGVVAVGTGVTVAIAVGAGTGGCVGRGVGAGGTVVGVGGCVGMTVGTTTAITVGGARVGITTVAVFVAGGVAVGCCSSTAFCVASTAAAIVFSIEVLDVAVCSTETRIVASISGVGSGSVVGTAAGVAQRTVTAKLIAAITR